MVGASLIALARTGTRFAPPAQPLGAHLTLAASNDARLSCLRFAFSEDGVVSLSQLFHSDSAQDAMAG